MEGNSNQGPKQGDEAESGSVTTAPEPANTDTELADLVADAAGRLADAQGDGPPPNAGEGESGPAPTEASVLTSAEPDAGAALDGGLSSAARKPTVMQRPAALRFVMVSNLICPGSALLLTGARLGGAALAIAFWTAFASLALFGPFFREGMVLLDMVYFRVPLTWTTLVFAPGQSTILPFTIPALFDVAFVLGLWILGQYLAWRRLASTAPKDRNFNRVISPLQNLLFPGLGHLWVFKLKRGYLYTFAAGAAGAGACILWLVGDIHLAARTLDEAILVEQLGIFGVLMVACWPVAALVSAWGARRAGKKAAGKAVGWKARFRSYRRALIAVILAAAFVYFVPKRSISESVREIGYDLRDHGLHLAPAMLITAAGWINQPVKEEAKVRPVSGAIAPPAARAPVVPPPPGELTPEPAPAVPDANVAEPPAVESPAEEAPAQETAPQPPAGDPRPDPTPPTPQPEFRHPPLPEAPPAPPPSDGIPL